MKSPTKPSNRSARSVESSVSQVKPTVAEKKENLDIPRICHCASETHNKHNRGVDLCRLLGNAAPFSVYYKLRTSLSIHDTPWNALKLCRK